MLEMDSPDRVSDQQYPKPIQNRRLKTDPGTQQSQTAGFLRVFSVCLMISFSSTVLTSQQTLWLDYIQLGFYSKTVNMVTMQCTRPLTYIKWLWLIEMCVTLVCCYLQRHGPIRSIKCSNRRLCKCCLS